VCNSISLIREKIGSLELNYQTTYIDLLLGLSMMVLNVNIITLEMSNLNEDLLVILHSFQMTYMGNLDASLHILRLLP